MLNNQDSIKDYIDVYLSKWKLILLCIILALSFAFLHLRYATYEYLARASIKIDDEKNSNKLPEISTLENYGMFSSDFNNIGDEIEIIKSRSLIEKVVDDLDLNIKYFIIGKIKEQEVYSNPPINLSFFESDSLINTIDTTLYITIKSSTRFTLINKKNRLFFNTENLDAKEHAFGDRITTGFGDFIITPRLGSHTAKPGTQIKIVMRPINKVAVSYQSKIIVAPTKEGSSIINLSLKESLKDKAKYILDKLIEKYNEDVINDKQLIVKATSDFINNRLGIVSTELEQVDFTAEKLQKRNRLTALESQSQIFLTSEKENETRIIDLSNQLQLINYMKDHMAKNNSSSNLLPTDIGIADNSVSQITSNHNELVLQRNRILRSSTIKNPIVINLNNQISELKDNLRQSLNNIEATNKITLNSLNQEDARIRSQIYSVPTKARQFRDVKRQQDIKESLYLYLLQKREETAISLGLSSPNAKIIDAAYASSTPISPKPRMVYIAAFIFGLAIPIGLIYISDILDSKIHDKKGLEEVLNLPFLGDIPKSETKKRLVKKIDYSPKAEAFRIIRSNIDFILKNNNKKCKTLFVTSTISQEGKSHTSVNLAISLSFSKKRVLLIETDIRDPKVNEYFNIKKGKGLTDFISDKSLSIEDVTVSISKNSYLDIITSGTIPPNPAELLMSDRVGNLFKKVQNEYDYIVVDTAAVGLVTDTLLISKFADMFIYVVSVNNIDKQQLHIAQTMYDEKRLPNMAVLLNGTVKKKGYGYGYGSNPKKKKWYKL
ncbi:MAG: polysaccharide biosynthesis tyrosine autokinase [Flavobacteriaceae bacterium]|nr:polysaccharide biosynthesis tyrosine autokinase [Flavobacteriaceae bacterium]